MDLFALVMLMLAACMVFLLFIGARNEWVYRESIRLIDTDYEKYKSLPSYEKILLKFWVWDINKFCSGEKK